MKEAVKKDDRISEVIKKHPESAPIMMKHGIHCVGCHAAFFETIEQGSQAHGMSEKAITKMVADINKNLKKNK
jgi:hybrid cluster-associated redox disulfide protein